MVSFNLATVALLCSVNVMALAVKTTNSQHEAASLKPMLLARMTSWKNIPACSSASSHPSNSKKWISCRRDLDRFQKFAKHAEERAKAKAAHGKKRKGKGEKAKGAHGKKRKGKGKKAKGIHGKKRKGMDKNATDEKEDKAADNAKREADSDDASGSSLTEERNVDEDWSEEEQTDDAA